MCYLKLIKDILNSQWVIEIGGSFLGVLGTYLLAFKVDRKQRKKKYNFQKLAVKDEITINQASVDNILKGLKKGFTLDKLSDQSTNSLLNNPDLYEFKESDNLITDLSVYQKTILIANETINFCFKHWSEGIWENCPNLEDVNIKTLQEKFNSVVKVGSRLTRTL